ncbi:thioesterase [Longispora fulva]|uniref:Acyl-CoA thioester hydrolase n=1 Tax=Longispora fulva TaxID=619741 RepID=A0A8J7KTB9_9ACTN|nr:thioesterase family protein [Longispora fulva]MBG6140562.1 acyl-CoA thioester hydrolase [Longispora fulva]GIG57056.1 thioesterase [Longispora fulva]
MSRAIHHAQVRWSDPDQLGHINHARYLSYFEDARMELIGTSPSGTAGGPDDRGYVAARVAVDYLFPVVYRPGLTLRVETWVSRLGTSSWTLSQELFDGDTPVVRSECVLVAYSHADKASRPLAEDERAFWEKLS